MGYNGPPAYEDQPLGLEEQLEEQAHQPEFEVGAPCAVPQAGQRPEYDRIDEVPGAQGLRPFTGTGGVPAPELSYQYPQLVPNCGVQQKGLRVFSVWGPRRGDGSFVARTPQFWQAHDLVRSPRIPDGRPALWTVDLWAYEQIRFVEDGPVRPLAENDIIREGGWSPDDQQGSQSSRLKARIMWWSSSGGTTRVVDVAQGVRCVLEAQLVTVEILYPVPGTVQVKVDRNNPLELAPDGGTVLDTVVGCAITPACSPPGRQIMTNTMVLEVEAAEADQPVFIPPGTRDLTVYQSSAGAIMVPTWRLGRSAAAPGPELGVIVLNPGQAAALPEERRALDLDRPGPAGMILTGPADQGARRLATFIFQLEI